MDYTIKSHPCGALPPEFDRLDLALDSLVPIQSAQEQQENEIDRMLEYYSSYNIGVSLDEYLLTDQINHEQDRLVEIQRRAIGKKREIRQQLEEIRDLLLKNLAGQIVDEPLNTNGLNYPTILSLQAEAKTKCDAWMDTQVGKIETKTRAEIDTYLAEIDAWEQLEIDICKQRIESYQAEIEARRSEPNLFPSPSHVKSGAGNRSDVSNGSNETSVNGSNGNGSDGSYSTNGNGNGHDSYHRNAHNGNGHGSYSSNGSASNGNDVNYSAPPPPQTNPPNSVGNTASQGANSPPPPRRKGDDRWRSKKSNPTSIDPL